MANVSDDEFSTIRQTVEQNPACWELDVLRVGYQQKWTYSVPRGHLLKRLNRREKTLLFLEIINRFVKRPCGDITTGTSSRYWGQAGNPDSNRLIKP